jgi:hypothetical protein
MIDNLALSTALRARALTLEVVASTGTFEATSTGYARASGSFFDDGFEVGQEVYGTDFALDANNEPKVITALSALVMTTDGFTVDAVDDRKLSGTSGTSTEAAGTRTLTVGLPDRMETENDQVKAGAGVPWWREEYSPGSGRRVGHGPNAELEYLVDYFITIFLPSDTGARAARRYQDALIAHFPPGYVVTPTPTPCRVRGDVVPVPGTLLQSVEPSGFLVVPVTVPTIVRTANNI